MHNRLFVYVSFALMFALVGMSNIYAQTPTAASPDQVKEAVEASKKKAEFLRLAIDACKLSRAWILDRQVQRGSDLGNLDPIDVPLPEPLPPVTNADFAPAPPLAEPAPAETPPAEAPKRAGDAA